MPSDHAKSNARRRAKPDRLATIFRTSHTRRFTVLDNAGIEALAGCPEELSTWVVAMKQPDDWSFRPDWLRERLGIGRDRMRRIIRSLTKKGYARWSVIRSFDKRFAGRELVFFETPELARNADRQPELFGNREWVEDDDDSAESLIANDGPLFDATANGSPRVAPATRNGNLMPRETHRDESRNRQTTETQASGSTGDSSSKRQTTEKPAAGKPVTGNQSPGFSRRSIDTKYLNKVPKQNVVVGADEIAELLTRHGFEPRAARGLVDKFGERVVRLYVGLVEFNKRCGRKPRNGNWRGMLIAAMSKHGTPAAYVLPDGARAAKTKSETQRERDDQQVDHLASSAPEEFDRVMEARIAARLDGLSDTAWSKLLASISAEIPSACRRAIAKSGARNHPVVRSMVYQKIEECHHADSAIA